MKRVVVLTAIVGVGVLGLLAARPAARQNVAEIQQVKDNLYVITGGGGNTAAFVTSGGVVVVDTKLAGWGQAILDKIGTVTDRPVTMIINTHTHGDHVGSNAEFPGTVEIVAHENAKASMQRMDAFAGANARFLPGRTYRDTVSLLDGDDRIDLRYFGAGHTNGDTIILFPALGAAHTGDLFARKGAPLIDTNNGGSGVAYPDTLQKAVAGITGIETVIPGHSAVTDWSAFREFAEFNRDFLAAVRQAMQDGKTAEEAAAGLSLPARYQAYSMDRAGDNVAKIYAELGGK